MTNEQKLDLMRRTGLIAIMRADSSDQLIAAADAIRAGGVRAIEVTMTTPGALETIRGGQPALPWRNPLRSGDGAGP